MEYSLVNFHFSQVQSISRAKIIGYAIESSVRKIGNWIVL